MAEEENFEACDKINEPGAALKLESAVKLSDEDRLRERRTRESCVK